MATFTLRNGSIQARVTHGLLPRPFYKTFETIEEARAFCKPLEDALHAGVIPHPIQKLLAEKFKRSELEFLRQAIAEYQQAITLAPHDTETLGILGRSVGDVRMLDITREWTLTYVRELKVVDRLKPGTIRKRIGTLRRLFHWLTTDRPEVTTVNPFAFLVKGYASINQDEGQLILASGNEVQADVERDRRLDSDEEDSIRMVLAGTARPDREREPALHDRDELELLLTLGLESAMRLREMYTLTADQVHLAKATIYLDKTKNGDSRQVPLTTIAVATISAYAKEKNIALHGVRKTTKKVGGECLFPLLFSGSHDRAYLTRTTSKISRRFGWLFQYAGLEDFRFHDLRHESICRIYERTSLTDIQIARITGHKDPRMLKRYASLRGSDLAVRLW